MRTLVMVSALLVGAEASAAVVIEHANAPHLRIGADGLGVVAYRALDTGSLAVAHCVDAQCSSVTIATVDSGDVGYRPSVVIAPDGRPVIAYLDRLNASLKLAFCGDAACTTSARVVVATDVGTRLGIGEGRTAVAIGADGRAVVAYTDVEPATPPPPPASERVRVAHCENASCTSVTITDVESGISASPVDIAVSNGRAVIMWTHLTATSYFPEGARCVDLACTSFTYFSSPFSFGSRPSLALQADGNPAFVHSLTDTTVGYVRCLDASCTATVQQTIPSRINYPSLALPAGGLPRFVAGAPDPSSPQLWMFRCLDADCVQRQTSCVAGLATHTSLATGPGGDLVAFVRNNNSNVEIRPVASPGPSECAIEMWVEDDYRLEGDPPAPTSASFHLRVGTPFEETLTVAYETVDGTAVAGSDYVAQSGVLTLTPRSSPAILVPLVSDGFSEPVETFSLRLTAVTGAAVVDGEAMGVILDDDEGGPPPPPYVGVAACTATEGDAGTTPCAFEVALSASTTLPVTVEFQTSGVTATAGTDFVQQSGVVTFPPGTTVQAVPVAVIGDTAVELDEYFRLALSNPTNALPGAMDADGWIVDEDAPSLSSIELTHGSRVDADLASAPGPVAQDDYYRFAQAPFSSYEVVVDGVSGDLAPGLAVERLAEDNSTVRDLAVPVGVGGAVSMRWVHSFGPAELRETLRVRSAACSSGCGPDDVYRLRFYETTASIPRFNNAGSQATVLIVQNLTDVDQIYHFWFWDESGAPIGSDYPMKVAAREAAVVNTGALWFLAGRSGSITIAHEAGYGGIAGKAVSLEPATGFAFDSPLVFKPR